MDNPIDARNCYAKTTGKHTWAAIKVAGRRRTWICGDLDFNVTRPEHPPIQKFQGINSKKEARDWVDRYAAGAKRVEEKDLG